MKLQLDYDGITDGTTMAQASTLVPVTKMKKARVRRRALFKVGKYMIEEP